MKNNKNYTKKDNMSLSIVINIILWGKLDKMYKIFSSRKYVKHFKPNRELSGAINANS
jgi:hypothetical protein